MFKFIKKIMTSKIPRPWNIIALIIILPNVALLLFSLVLMFFSFAILPILESLYWAGFYTYGIYAITLFISILILLLHYKYSKERSKTKLINRIILIFLIESTMYFWIMAWRWENILSESWTDYPELSNLSAILEYLKALVKTISLNLVVFQSWLFFKKK